MPSRNGLRDLDDDPGMTERARDDLTPRRAWLLGLALVGRVLLTLAVLLAVYYLVPFDSALDASLVVWLLGSLVLLTALGVYQVRAILESPLPRMKAIEALTTLIPLLLISFASTFYLMSQDDPSNFTEPLTRTDALYFVVTVFSTVGFGDITAESQTARSGVTAQIVVNLVVVGLGLRIIVGAAERRGKNVGDARE